MGSHVVRGRIAILVLAVLLIGLLMQTGAVYKQRQIAVRLFRGFYSQAIVSYQVAERALAAHDRVETGTIADLSPADIWSVLSSLQQAHVSLEDADQVAGSILGFRLTRLLNESSINGSFEQEMPLRKLLDEIRRVVALGYETRSEEGIRLDLIRRYEASGWEGRK